MSGIFQRIAFSGFLVFGLLGIQVSIALAEQALWEQKEWLRLGHYRSSIFGGYSSEVDSPVFFLSKEGKGDPKKELEATIESFSRPLSDFEDEQEHPLCRFPARKAWLIKEGAIDEKGLPQPDCEEYRKYLWRHSAKSAAIVFSSYYMESASSTFGHTFLRISKTRDRLDGNARRHELLDYGVNYGADATTRNPVLYALFGIIGVFKGTFSSVPYYNKVREYNDFESRDLWSYELELTDSELQRLMDHLWELGPSYFDYFFFTENCSYHILAAVEAALEVNDGERELPDLIDDLPYWVIPGDTVKVIAKKPGLLRAVQYRPSIRTQFLGRLRRLNSKKEKILRELIDSREVRSLQQGVEDRGVRAEILDAAIDYMEFRYPNDLIESGTESSKWKQALLVERAKLGLKSAEFTIEPRKGREPHLAHDSARVALGYGHEDLLGSFSDLSMRFALHDLLDSSQGYPENARIEFMHLTGRYYWEDQSWGLTKINLLEAFTLSPASFYEKHLSWGFLFGGRRITDSNCDRCFAGGAEASVGWTERPFSWSVLYGLVDGELLFSPEFLASNLRIGGGPRLGVVFLLSSRLKGNLEGRYRYLLFSKEPEFYAIQSEIRWTFYRGNFGSNWAAGVKAAKYQDANEFQGEVLYYF